jgi:hypothetical protein
MTVVFFQGRMAAGEMDTSPWSNGASLFPTTQQRSDLPDGAVIYFKQCQQRLAGKRQLIVAPDPAKRLQDDRRGRLHLSPMFAQVSDGPNGRHPHEAIVIGQKPFHFDQERLDRGGANDRCLLADDREYESLHIVLARPQFMKQVRDAMLPFLACDTAPEFFGRVWCSRLCQLPQQRR